MAQNFGVSTLTLFVIARDLMAIWRRDLRARVTDITGQSCCPRGPNVSGILVLRARAQIGPVMSKITGQTAWLLRRLRAFKVQADLDRLFLYLSTVRPGWRNWQTHRT